MATSLVTGTLVMGSPDGKTPSYLAKVESDLIFLSGGAELLYAIPLTEGFALDVGAGLGVGAFVGSVVNNWVYENPEGDLSFGSKKLTSCRTVNDGLGCRPQDHATPKPVRVGGYRDRPGASGSLVPAVFPEVTFPTVGLRISKYDPLLMRVSAGLSLTGIWLGFGGSFDLDGASPAK